MSQRTGDIRSDTLCNLHSDDIRGIVVPQDLAHKFLNAITIFQEKFCHTAEKKKGKEKKKEKVLNFPAYDPGAAHKPYCPDTTIMVDWA